METKIFKAQNKQLNESYEVIENELVHGRNFDGLTVSGSLLSLSTFKNVIFKSCTFFGSNFENCNFVGCKFIDCSFQFSNILHCNFKRTSLQNCIWDNTLIQNCEFQFCNLEAKTAFFALKEENHLWECFYEQENVLNWEEAIIALKLSEEKVEEEKIEEEGLAAFIWRKIAA